MLLCTVVVYLIVPLGNKYGMEFNEAARSRVKLDKFAKLFAARVEEEASDIGSSLSHRLSELAEGRSVMVQYVCNFHFIWLCHTSMSSSGTLASGDWDVPFEAGAKQIEDLCCCCPESCVPRL